MKSGLMLSYLAWYPQILILSISSIYDNHLLGSCYVTDLIVSAWNSMKMKIIEALQFNGGEEGRP